MPAQHHQVGESLHAEHQTHTQTATMAGPMAHNDCCDKPASCDMPSCLGLTVLPVTTTHSATQPPYWPPHSLLPVAITAVSPPILRPPIGSA
jgi:hypothetical protein